MKNWIERHLNWSWTIAIVASIPIAVIANFLLGCYIGLTVPEMTDETLDFLAGVVTNICVYGIWFGMSLYVILQKGRSWAWIFLSGWFSALWLSNKKVSS